MATLSGDSLFSVSQRFLSPDILQKMSNEINLPVEKTKVGVMSVIPTLLMGIVNKGSTPEGAASLVDMASKQTPPADVSADSATLQKGNEFLSGIFGNNLANTVSSLGVSTGMNTSNVSKIMGMAAPMVMGIIGSKVKNEKLSASGLMSFLGQQKNSLIGLIPAGIPMFSGMQSKISKSSTWPKIVLAALLIGAGVWWLNARYIQKTAPVMPAVSLPSMPDMSRVLGISTLESFMKSNVPVGTLKRFRFERLNFVSGTATMVSGAEVELNQIVAAMKNYPNTTATIEGFTDNVGTPTNNQVLSRQRAAAVKVELVARGIDANRINVVGMGENNPIATNTTAEGRAANRRVEFVIKR